MDTRPLTINITPGSFWAGVGIGLLLWLLFFLRDLVLIVLTAIVLSSAVEPGVHWFVKKRFPRAVAVLSIYALIVGVFLGIIYLLLPPLVEEVRGFIVDLPQFLSSLRIDSIFGGSTVSALQPFIPHEFSAALLAQLQSFVIPTGQGALQAVYSIFGGIISFILIIILSIYFAFQETGVDDFLKIVIPVKHQHYALDLWKRSRHKIGLWMQGQLILSLIIGVLGYLWLSILQVPYAFLIAIFAACVEIIPMFGSLVSGTLAVIIGATTGGTQLALFVAGGFLVINLLQSNLIYPLVVKRVVGVPPLMVILAMIAGGQLAGFYGILLAVPLAAALQEFVTDIEKSKTRELAELK
ncbi:MAG: hypothetical protein Greene07147_515 [Parcubacteria group bacterium Greene0714_7]|nr:MAG: hypothetical protein Greene07147_515 [Parcubacteria group bacterium Greene0714_7]